MANKLSLNVAKTEFQIIGTKQMLKKACVQQLKIHIQNIPIKQVFQCKTLGVTITRNMGRDGDGHAHFDQIWRPNITINYMGVDQNIKF